MANIDALVKQPETHEWATPQAFFDTLHAEFGFTLDAAADETNHKVDRWYGFGGLGINGLAHSWSGEVVWCNPPYGRFIADWVRKGYQEAISGATVAMLIPARTDTAYWHDYCMRAAEIRFVRTRLPFIGEARVGHNAPFPSALVVFRPDQFGSPNVSAIDRTARFILPREVAA